MVPPACPLARWARVVVLDRSLASVSLARRPCGVAALVAMPPWWRCRPGGDAALVAMVAGVRSRGATTWWPVHVPAGARLVADARPAARVVTCSLLTRPGRSRPAACSLDGKIHAPDSEFNVLEMPVRAPGQPCRVPRGGHRQVDCCQLAGRRTFGSWPGRRTLAQDPDSWRALGRARSRPVARAAGR
jgi:hypothetical protein